VNAETIPAELRQRTQWVVWRRTDRDGGTTKVPYRADGAGRASSTDPATWGTFGAAVAALERPAVDLVNPGFERSDRDAQPPADLRGRQFAIGDKLADSHLGATEHLGDLRQLEEHGTAGLTHTSVVAE
jgi:putative DNA primase/helicase